MKLSKLLVTALCVITLTFTGFASPSLASTINNNQEYYFLGFFDNLFNKTQATEKQLEGKIQEEAGKATDNTKDEIVGKAKQVQGKTMEVVEDMKQSVQEMSEDASKSLKEMGDQATEKIQELQGK